MGYLGVGGFERNLLVGQANSEGAALVGRLGSGYVDQNDMAMATDMIQKMQAARPNIFSGPCNQMAWQQQMNGAVNIYNMVQNRLSSQVNSSVAGVNPNFDLSTQQSSNAQPNFDVAPYVAPQPFFCPRPYVNADPYYTPQPFYGATMGEEFAGAAVASLGAFELMRHLEGNRFRYDPTLDFSRGARFEQQNLRQLENRNEPRPFMPVVRGWHQR